jgi:hypothetical protein
MQPFFGDRPTAEKLSGPPVDIEGMSMNQLCLLASLAASVGDALEPWIRVIELRLDRAVSLEPN